MRVFFSLFVLSAVRVFSAEPLTLAQAEEIAIRENKTVQATRQLLEKAKQGKLESYSKWLPQLYGISEGYVTQKKQNPIFNHKHSFITQLVLTQALFSSDKYYNVQISDLYVKQLGLLLEAAVNDVLFQVRTSYYLVILDQKNIATAKENIDLFTSLAKKMEGYFVSGLAILYDLNQSKVIVANALTRYYQAVKSYKIDRDYLVETLGYEPGSITFELIEREFPLQNYPDIAFKLKSVETIFQNQGYSYDSIYIDDFVNQQDYQLNKMYSKEEISTWEKLAEKYRPSLLLTENRLSIAKKTVEKNAGEYLPEVNMRGTLGGWPIFFVFDPSTHFDNQVFTYGLTVSLSWNLFDGLGRERRIKASKYERSAFRFEYENALLQAFADVRKQIFSIEEAIASYLSSKGNIDLAKETLVLAKERLEVGYVTIYDYQITVDGLIQARFNFDQAQYDILVAYYGLRHAAGIDADSYL